MENFQVFFQSQSSRRKFLLVVVYVLGQFPRRVNENEPFAAFQARQEPLMVLGVLPHPRVAVVDEDGRHVFVSESWENYKPLGQEVCFETVAGPGMGEVHYDLIWLGIVRLQCQQNMIYQQVPIDLASLKPGWGKINHNGNQ